MIDPQHRSGIIPRLFAIGYLVRRAYYPYRHRILILGCLSALGGIFEGIGINAVIPLLSYIVDANGPATDTLTGIMRGLFQFLHLDFAPKYLLFFIVVMFMLRGVAMFLVAYVQAVIVSNYSRETKNTIFRSIMRASWSHVMKQRLGHLETVLMVDVPASESLLRYLAGSTTLLSSIAIYLLVALTMSPLITGITLIIGASVVFASKPLVYRIRMLAGVRVQLNRDITHLTGEHILGMKTVKAAGVEEKILKRGRAYFQQFRDLYIRLTLLQQTTQFLIPPLGILYIALIFGVAYKTHFISMAVLPAIFYLIYRIFFYVQQAQDALQRANDQAPHLQSVLSFMDASVAAEEATAGSKAFSFARELAFRGVSYRYEGSERDVLHDVSCTVPRGALVGIIGPSGAGKTTCVDLILRLLGPTNGSIMLDDTDVRSIALSEWRKKTAYVSQDIFLIHDTIANNIRFYDESLSDTDVREAARMAHLDDVISSNVEGVDATVGERGQKFSAGQRQRIAIARALAHKPEILILDEATSALDTESEAAIKRILDELKGRITIIAIAHRLSTIMDADLLIALEGGRVVEVGSPQKLMDDKSSYFHKVSSLV